MAEVNAEFSGKNSGGKPEKLLRRFHVAAKGCTFAIVDETDGMVYVRKNNQFSSDNNDQLAPNVSYQATRIEVVVEADGTVTGLKAINLDVVIFTITDIKALTIKDTTARQYTLSERDRDPAYDQSTKVVLNRLRPERGHPSFKIVTGKSAEVQV